MSIHSSSCFRRRQSPPSPIPGNPNLTTYLYQTHFALFSLTWSRSLLSRSLHFHYHQNPIPFHTPHSPSPSSFHLHFNSFILFNKKGFKILSSNTHIFWDFTRAKISSSSPEPRSGFYLAFVVDREMILLVGDLIKEAYEKTKAMKSQNPQSLVLRREHVIARKIYTTRARIGGEVREIGIDCGFFNDESSLNFSVDEKRVLEIRRIKWKFRGNERIEVDGIPVHIYWDVYNWVFDVKKQNGGNRNRNGNGNGVFMFRFEEEESEFSGRQQNWNMGMNEFEWRKMRNSLSSSVSVSVSMSSGSSSAGGSSSVMEWANMEESDLNGVPFGFSLLVYAWRK